MSLDCVHFQDAHNLVKTPTPQRCPWCYAESLEQRLRQAEGMIADALGMWNAAGAGHFRDQQLRMETYRQFLDQTGKP